VEDEVGVAIVGGGPAGSTLAALLARRGIAVALIDRDTFPRDKLCGEFLSYDALPILERLGVLHDVDERGAPHISLCRVIGSKRTLTFDFPDVARGISRMTLDDLLFRAAIAAGAQNFAGWTAEKIASGTLELRRGEERRTLRARAIAGAWGRWGRFDTELGRGFVRDRSHRNFGFKRHYFAASQPEAIELFSFRDGYLGVNAIEDGLTNICGLVHASRLSGHKGRWDAFVETIRTEEPRLEELYSRHVPAQSNWLSSEPVIFRARSPVEGGIFMIGDASGIIDPLTGNGMAMAIQSALLVAPSLVRLLEKPGDRRRIEREYRSRHHTFFGSRISWSRRVARLLSRPRLLDVALASVRSRAIGRFLLRRTRATRENVARLADQWFAPQSG
jgi:flavin-dependent dehydrogenase